MQELGHALGKKSCEDAENGCTAAWLISLFSFVVSIFLVSAVWLFWFLDNKGDALGERNYASPIGWCAAAAAAVAFGFVEVSLQVDSLMACSSCVCTRRTRPSIGNGKELSLQWT